MRWTKNLRTLPVSMDVLIHAGFWVIYLVYPVIQFGNEDWYTFEFSEVASGLFFTAIPVYILFFSFLRRTPSLPEVAGLACLFLVAVVLPCVFDVEDCGCSIKACVLNKLAETLLIGVFFISTIVVKRNIASQRRLLEMEKERTSAELSALKSQLNPHFLFNTLNMLYSDAMRVDEQLAGRILMLSDSLHYLLHQGDKPEVKLTEEIKFIEDYISLQRSRMGDKIKVDLTLAVDNKFFSLPPLLLLPFVENAFKYSSMVEGKSVPIYINVELKKNVFKFEVKNRCVADERALKKEWKDSGIGIKNAQRRLEILFPQTYSLHFNRAGDFFNVALTITSE